jgi:hypothetical protein
MPTCSKKTNKKSNVDKYMSTNLLPGLKFLVGTSQDDIIKTSVSLNQITAEAYYIDKQHNVHGVDMQAGWVIKLSETICCYVKEEEFTKYFNIIDEED